MSFASDGRGSSSIRRWSRPRTLFSWPAVVCMAYQRYSISSLYLTREPRDSFNQYQLQHIVHQSDREPQHNGEHDDHSGGLDQLRTSWPGHLLELVADRREEPRGAGNPADQLVRARTSLCRVHAYLDSLCTR